MAAAISQGNGEIEVFFQRSIALAMRHMAILKGDMSNNSSRRRFLKSAAAVAAVALPSSALLADAQLPNAYSSSNGVRRGEDANDLNSRIALQVELEATQAFFTSFYEAKNELTAADFLKHYSKSSLARYEDGTLGLRYDGFEVVSAAFDQFIPTIANALGVGHFSRIYNVAGDLRYGAIVEYVNIRNTFFSTNGMTVQTVFDLDEGLVLRDIDYWDSGELGSSDIVGPTNTTGVAAPLGPIHPGGIPRTSAIAPPGQIALSTNANGSPSASPSLIQFVSALHSAMRSGSVRELTSFFTEDALLIHPLIHQGPFLYGNYDQTIQIRGRDLIIRFFNTVLDLLPDGRDSKLNHIVGSMAGGGFEWKAGGVYERTGLDRSGLVGCTSLNLFNDQIQRMGVRFDSFQMPRNYYDAVKRALLISGVVDDQQPK